MISHRRGHLLLFNPGHFPLYYFLLDPILQPQRSQALRHRVALESETPILPSPGDSSLAEWTTFLPRPYLLLDGFTRRNVTVRHHAALSLDVQRYAQLLGLPSDDPL